MKVVVNRRYGGFGLSEKAYKELGLKWDGYGFLYNLPREFKDLEGEQGRANPKLVDIVEKLGTEANGESATLEIVEIPDDVSWHIAEYDGYEHIAEDHRTW